MALLIISPGLQTTIQAAPRRGLRHRGVPAAGPADGVSAALVNRAVGNRWDTPLLEITLGGFTARLRGPATFAVGGAVAGASLGKVPIDPWTPIRFGRAEQEIHIEPAKTGARVYLAIAGGIAAEWALGSASTYLPARLGGFGGRTLKEGDQLDLACADTPYEAAAVPPDVRPFLSSSWVLPVMPSGETKWLSPAARRHLFEAGFTVSRQTSRMGVGLEGAPVEVPARQLSVSVPVFPGTVQCPESGDPFVLAADAQTTGGYPRVAQVIRADRHRLGQLRPGDKVTFAEVALEEAADTLNTKKAALAAFLGSEFRF